jgi:hypothetical protein
MAQIRNGILLYFIIIKNQAKEKNARKFFLLLSA